MPKYLHSKAKESGLNLSKEITFYLNTVLFGDQVSDVNYQLEQINNRLKDIDIEKTTLLTRKSELEKIINEHDLKLSVEKTLYNRFINHVNNRIDNSINGNITLDINRILNFWASDFFPGNGVNKQTVIDVFELAKKNDFNFDDFCCIRRCGSIER